MFRTVSSSKVLISQFLEWFEARIFFWQVVRAAVAPFDSANCFDNSTRSDHSPCRWSLWPAPPPGLYSVWKPVFVMGAVNDAHASGSYLVENAVAVEGLSGHRLPSCRELLLGSHGKVGSPSVWSLRRQSVNILRGALHQECCSVPFLWDALVCSTLP
jgi:hypothetical protein